MNWESKYSTSNIKNWNLPAAEQIDSNEGIYSRLYLKWSEIPKNKENGDLFEQYIICADVLFIDEPILVEVGTVIFARRIEFTKDAGIISLNRLSSQTPFLIVAQEVKDTQGNDATLKVETSTKKGVLENEIVLTCQSEQVGVNLNVSEWVYGNDKMTTYTADKLDEGYFLEGDPLRVYMRTTFQLATLLCTESTEDRSLSISQYRWISDLATATEDTRTIGGQARALASNLHLMEEQKKNVLLVPYLDYSLYSESAKAFMELLNRRQAKYDLLISSIDNTKNWKEAAQAILQKDKIDEGLNLKLLNKAKDSRQQVLIARTTIAKQIANQRIKLYTCEKDFEAGIKIWKLEADIKAAFGIIAGIFDILSTLPTMIVAGPQMGIASIASIGKAVIGFTLNEVSKNVAGTTMPLSSTAGSGGLGLLDNAKDYLRGQQLDVNSQVLGRDWALMSGYGNEPDDPNDPNDPSVPDWPNFSDPDIGPPFEIPPAPPAPPVTVDFDTATQNDIKKVRLTAKELAAARKAAQAQFEKGISQIGQGADKIAGAVENIIANAEKARKLTNAANNALLSTNSAIDQALSSNDLQGIDVITGGAQDWDDLALALDNLLENNQYIPQIIGGPEYRIEIKRLILLGKTFAMTKLAVAKANADLAEMILRERASKEALDIYQERFDLLADKVVQDNTIAQLTFGKILDAKRSVYIAMESYRRAFIYYSLIDEDKAPALPKFTSSVDEFYKVGANIAGKLLAVSSLTDQPQKTGNREQIIPAAKLPKTMFKCGGCTIDVKPDAIVFNGFYRWRLEYIEVYADGLDAVDGNILVHITSSGQYADKDSNKKIREFASLPYHKTFSYNGRTGAPDITTQLPGRLKNDFFLPTPFSKWTIRIEHQDPKVKLDFTKITQLRIVYKGETTNY